MQQTYHHRTRRFLLHLGMLLFLWAGAAEAHDVNIPMIIDTDGAVDDLRAITMLINAGMTDIRLIATSDGAVSPETGGASVMRLIGALDREDIAVAAGRELPMEPPPFRKTSENLAWPGDPGKASPAPKSAHTAAEAIAEALEAAEEKSIIYFCLGPMTNLADVLTKDPALGSRIFRVLYAGASPAADNPGWNTERDLASATAVFQSGLPIYSINIDNARRIVFDEKMYANLCARDTDAAALLCSIHDTPDIRKKISDNHMRVWDEMAIIYMNSPQYYQFRPDRNYKNVMTLADFDAEGVKSAWFRLLGHPGDFHVDAREAVVLKEFPMDSSMFREDVAPYIQDILKAHGAEEFKACLITNELHRHLGGYSLVGAKMGIHARELLGAPFDALEVVSFAGSKPPLSCINDGLQVSTGASLGRGTIVVEEAARPSATFIYRNTALTLTLKPYYTERIEADIAGALEQFGAVNPAYFDHIRELSIQYWIEFDRTALFEAEKAH
jgi:pyrimidine-specific ribonucleoside hydrolase